MKDSLILKVVIDASTTTPAQPAQGPRWSSDPDPFYLKNYYKLYISWWFPKLRDGQKIVELNMLQLSTDICLQRFEKASHKHPRVSWHMKTPPWKLSENIGPFQTVQPQLVFVIKVLQWKFEWLSDRDSCWCTSCILRNTRSQSKHWRRFRWHVPKIITASAREVQWQILCDCGQWLLALKISGCVSLFSHMFLPTTFR